MSIFVFYNDDYYDVGGVGLQECKDYSEAESFIQKRMACVDKPNINNYTVILGNRLNVKGVIFATRVKIE